MDPRELLAVAVLVGAVVFVVVVIGLFFVAIASGRR